MLYFYHEYDPKQWSNWAKPTHAIQLILFQALLKDKFQYGAY